MVSDSLPVSQLRDHLAEVMRNTETLGARTYLTNRGRRVAAIIPVDEAERLDALEDDYLLGLAKKAKANQGRRRTSHAELLAELAEEG